MTSTDLVNKENPTYGELVADLYATVVVGDAPVSDRFWEDCLIEAHHMRTLFAGLGRFTVLTPSWDNEHLELSEDEVDRLDEEFDLFRRIQSSIIQDVADEFEIEDWSWQGELSPEYLQITEAVTKGLRAAHLVARSLNIGEGAE